VRFGLTPALVALNFAKDFLARIECQIGSNWRRNRLKLAEAAETIENTGAEFSRV